MTTPDPRALPGHASHAAARSVPRRLIARLACFFPAAFVADRRQPHKPLKIGIDADLIAAGMLTPREASSALRCYTSRRMYYVATVAGGVRFDLDGKVAGEVTPQAAAWAGRKLAETRNAAPASRKAPRDVTHVRPSTDIRRLSLADLRAAAAARRAGQAQGKADTTVTNPKDHAWARCRRCLEAEGPRHRDERV